MLAINGVIPLPPPSPRRHPQVPFWKALVPAKAAADAEITRLNEADKARLLEIRIYQVRSLDGASLLTFPFGVVPLPLLPSPHPPHLFVRILPPGPCHDRREGPL